MAVKTYDPGQILITFAGNPILGYSDSTFVTVERDEDAYSKKVGADGEVARARNRNRSGSVKFTLMQSSPSNDVLSALAAQDELTGLGVGPLMVKDALGTTLFSAANAWVKKLPSVEFGKELSNREWTIDCDVLQGVAGGLL